MIEQERSLISYSYSLKYFDPGAKRELVERGLDALSETGDADFYFRKGEEHRLKGEIRSAISYYERALQIEPEHKDSLFYIGYCYIGCFDEITGEHIEDDIELDRDKRYKQAELIFKKLINIKNRANELDIELCTYYYNYGVALYDQDELNRAMDSFYQSLKFEYDYAPAYKMLALVKLWMGLKEEALKDCEKAIEINPNKESFFNTFGLIKEKMGLIDKAVENYEYAIGLNPSYVYANVNLGWLLYDEHRYEEVVGVIEDAIELNPDYADFYYLLAQAQEALEMKNEALENFKTFLRLVNHKTEDKQESIKIAKERIGKLQKCGLEGLE